MLKLLMVFGESPSPVVSSLKDNTSGSLFHKGNTIVARINLTVVDFEVYLRGTRRIAKKRLSRIFLRDTDSQRLICGGREKFQTDPFWSKNIDFLEYFQGDIGAGLGASHQTGWVGLVAKLIECYSLLDPKRMLQAGSQPVFTDRARAAG
jgi:hypothetical protein